MNPEPSQIQLSNNHCTPTVFTPGRCPALNGKNGYKAIKVGLNPKRLKNINLKKGYEIPNNEALTVEVTQTTNPPPIHLITNICQSCWFKDRFYEGRMDVCPGLKTVMNTINNFTLSLKFYFQVL